jgi:RecA/RadA recombinase
MAKKKTAKKAASKKKAVKKKATKKKKAAKKKKSKDKDSKEKKKEYEPPIRLSMKEVNAKYIEASGTSFVVKPEHFDIFALNRIYTSLVDVDFVLKPAFGKRICIIGDESVGKTVMCHIFAGAAQQTCRDCFMPIIEWSNPMDPTETKVSCKCGRNNPMVVLHIDVEDSFDPPWARRWGVRIGDEKIKRKGFDMIKSDDESFWVAIPREGNAAFDFAVDAIMHGAVDVVIFDSLAMLVPREVQAVGVGEARIAPQARLASEGLRKITSAQIVAKSDFNARATVIWTNQYYLGPTRNPKQDPRRPSGGKRAQYIQDLEMKIIWSKIDFDARKNRTGADKSVRYIDVGFETRKGKAGGPPLGQGQYRLYLDAKNTKHGMMTAGDTDDYDRLFAYLSALGYYRKTKSAHVILGREFKRVSDMRAFLMRRDIGYVCRYLIFRDMLPVTAKDHLRKEHYEYSPFGLDPFIKATEEVSEPSGEIDVSGEAEADREESKIPSWLQSSLPEEK